MKPRSLLRPLLVLSALYAALAGLLTPAPGAAQRRAPRPNFLFVIADDWSYGHAGAYGCKWVSTPAFDRVAREGIRFNNCFTSNPKCSPGRASLLTGRNSWQTEEASCHYGVFPKKWAVYPDLLEAAGYHVGFTGKGWGPGDFRAGGFRRNPAGTAYNEAALSPPHTAMSSIDYARNFSVFLGRRKPGQPFCFWLGASEPHRPYQEGIGRAAGKRPEEVRLPAFYPDSSVIRSDYLDYAVEVEWFDAQLGRALQHLQAAGELDNTLIVVTSDHGAPFPRIKGQIYDEGFHLPLAIRWGARSRPGRVVEDFINVRDFAPTFVEAAGLAAPATMTGKSFMDVLVSDRSGWIDARRNRMLVGKERHDLGRPNDAGYPVRALRTPEYLYVRNYEPDRWPVGNPETGYGNCDSSPTKTLLTSKFDSYYRLCFGKRPAEELYRIPDDPDCVRNLAAVPELAEVKQRLSTEMEALLRKDEDPRILGRGSVFDSYPYVGSRDHSYEAWLKNQ